MFTIEFKLQTDTITENGYRLITNSEAEARTLASVLIKNHAAYVTVADLNAFGGGTPAPEPAS